MPDRQKPHRPPVVVVSTFSGIGGSSEGYAMAGCDVRAAVEFHPKAAEIYRLNHPDTVVIQADIRNIHAEAIYAAAGTTEIDILDGSPPCSAFSSNDTNSKKTKFGNIVNYRGIKQRVDNLWDEQIRLISEIKPKIAVIENVPAMTHKHIRPLLNNYIIQIENLGYRVSSRIMDASMFGCATMRKRLITIAIRHDIDTGQELHPRMGTVRTAIKDVIMPEPSEADLREADMMLCPYVINGIKYTTPGTRFVDNTGTGINSFVINKGRPLPTIVANGCIMFDKDKDRVMTIREIARCQGYDSEIRWADNLSYNMKIEHLGRTVPPGMMRTIATHIREEVLPRP